MRATRIAVLGGAALYAGAVVLVVAGFGAILPFVVVPPVLIGLIAGGSLLGGRDHGRGRGPVRTSGAPLSSSGPNAAADPAPDAPAAGPGPGAGGASPG